MIRSIKTTQSALALAMIMLAGLSPLAKAQEPAANESAVANVTVVVMPGDTYTDYNGTKGDDSLQVIYRRAIPFDQVKHDLVALDALQKIDSLQFADAQGNGINDPQRIDPASITISAKNVIPAGARHFTIEPLILAFKSYKKIRLIFLTRPLFAFDGLRDYRDQYVHISFTSTAPTTSNGGQQNATYVYFVTVDNPQFTSLNLPLTSQDAASRSPDGNIASGRLQRLKIVLAVWLVVVVATLAGWALYRKLNNVRNAYNKALAVSNSHSPQKGYKSQTPQP